MKAQATYKISGHETFPLRYAWLPKAVKALKDNPKIFSDEDDAMISLGVGKNMVRAIRFWSEATGIIKFQGKNGFNVTEFGEILFDEDGLDPYLEDIQTLWLIHWKLSTQVLEPLFAWDNLLNQWQEPDLTRTAVLRFLLKKANSYDKKLSPVTIEQHLDTFLHTYIPTRGRKGHIHEDNLDCPLVELGLIQKVGERENDNASGKRELIYRFSRELKPEISDSLFAYCLHDFFTQRYPTESTLSFREISVGHGSPGQIFKLPESDLRERLEILNSQTNTLFGYRETQSIQQISKRRTVRETTLIKSIYDHEKIFT
ncbi:hypothetical protein B188_09110 [Candidatus Brocadiaceae bacterium B188]|nr:DUF4007 family protein [Candidatus Brocadia sapporoensis]QQR66039.1 MAG: DUF4007 family protein [Candidatus Brocadia sp.]RZV57645.1 MAG: DUF4007 family protein [Candidatus Brocadia sp. BROELEC01]TWU52948.1 hypothetical protein B188_09110 [Candidatus Brocadiaceae bacterium B188]